MRPAINIILPCYNPYKDWYKELLGFYDAAKGLYELNFILVNDGSLHTEFLQQAEQLKLQGVAIQCISYSKNKGKGYALRQGVQAGQSPFSIYTDVDFPFTNQSMLVVISALVNSSSDVVAGYRNNDYYRNTMPFYRKLLSKLFRFFIKRILGMPVTDTQCGLKGFNEKGKVKFLQTTINRYLFDFEFIHAAVKDKRLEIKTVQVELKKDVVFSRMKLKIFLQEAFNLLYVLLFKRA